MSDLISREAAIAAVERREKYLVGDKRVDVESVKNFLANRPAVDAVGVVRCKDCVYRGNLDICPMTYEYPTDHAFDMTENDDFYSKGKKIDEEV